MTFWNCARSVDFFEIHAENYMGAGGPPHHLLTRIRADYPISIHGVGLSIGGAQPLDRDHLAQLKSLIGRYQPALFSEHLAWSAHDGVFLKIFCRCRTTAKRCGGSAGTSIRSSDTSACACCLKTPRPISSSKPPA